MKAIINSGKKDCMLPLTKSRLLIPVAGKPYIYFVLKELEKNKFKEVDILSYEKEKIEEFLKKEKFNLNIKIKQQENNNLQIENINIPNLSNPWDILEINEFLLKSIKADIQGIVESNATLKNEVIIGKNTIIKNGSYIEGPVIIGENCQIGPNCYIREYTSIGNNCKIGNSVEIKNSVIMDNCNVSHLSYIGDSIIGENTNIAAGNITANLRHDNQNIKTIINNKLIDTKRRKFGTIIGDNVHTGINTLIYPGRKIFSNKTTLPGEIVKKDLI